MIKMKTCITSPIFEILIKAITIHTWIVGGNIPKNSRVRPAMITLPPCVVQTRAHTTQKTYTLTIIVPKLFIIIIAMPAVKTPANFWIALADLMPRGCEQT